MIYLLELDGRTYRVRDEWQALWLARVWVAVMSADRSPERCGVQKLRPR